jgi:hypothetical protein
MAATRADAISPELVLVSPELRAALATEFRSRALAAAGGRPSAGSPADTLAVARRRPSGWRRRPLRPGVDHGRSVAASYPAAVAVGAYAAQRVVAVTMQGVALVAVLIIAAFALTHA